MTVAGPLGLQEREKGGVFFLFGEDAFRKEERTPGPGGLAPRSGNQGFQLRFAEGIGGQRREAGFDSRHSSHDGRVEGGGSAGGRGFGLQPSGSGGPPGSGEIAPDRPGVDPHCHRPEGIQGEILQGAERFAHSVEYPEVGPNDVPGWIVEWAATRHGREITEEAARALGAGVGTNLGVLAQEVEKLASLVETGEPIGVEAVKAAGTLIPSEDRWVWMDRVGRREFGDALDGLEILFAQGESGVALTIGLANHLIRLALARSGGAKALDAALPPHQKWLVPRLVQQAKAWSLKELEDAILGLRRVDRLLKSSSLSDDQVLEEWILGLMVRSGAQGERRAGSETWIRYSLWSSCFLDRGLGGAQEGASLGEVECPLGPGPDHGGPGNPGDLVDDVVLIRFPSRSTAGDLAAGKADR